MEAYNKLLALRLTSDAPGAATRHVEQFRNLEGQVNLDDNELVIDLFRGSLTCSIQEKFERNPPGKRWEWYREVEEIDRQRMLLQQSSARHSLPNATSPPLRTGSRPNQSSIPIHQPTQPYPARSPAQTTTQATIQNLNQPTNQPLPHHPTQPSKQGSPAPSGINTCHVCKGIGHWARDCPSRRVDPCHGPGCSRSRRVTGSYGRSTGIRDLVKISSQHGRSAVSMETMDSYGLTCKGGPSTAMRRTKLKEQAQPRRGPSSRSMQMVTTQGLERQEPKELTLIKGGGAVSKESTPGHEEEEQC
ncbi:hypothetical protein NDA10_000315 [Ustilago hordei]|nr:hypothetical protein NDA10_000315 [Ustilago hordei]UTT90671.1 hypothetical protein NDA17_003220 [Ustilago hordei]